MSDTNGIAGPPRLMMGDCLERMKEIPDSSINLIACDPPYYRVKAREAWDRQWKTPGAFLDWMGRLCGEWRRVLAPNGSLYVFASPRMAARVECKVGEWFEVLNQIVWSKADMPTHALKYGDDRFRQYIQKSERIIFAEHLNADSMALGESGYAAKCEALRGFVFEPILDYLLAEFKVANLSRREVDEYFDTSNVSQYWLQARGFIIPTADKWAGLRAIRPEHFRREYEDLRREYEDLRREYEDLRRPFTVTAQSHYTDVWEFPTVPHRPGKHPCQKPYDLLAHIITASSRPGDVVLDAFMGSGVTGEAAVALGRRFVGIEQDPKWFDRATRRIEGAVPVEATAAASHQPAGRGPTPPATLPGLDDIRPRAGRRPDRRDDAPMFHLWSETASS